ncbi:helix-turn-helix domain-containing protein (plasmid) [Streptomyces sp. NBC_00536]|uniref:MarR family transcriptional regulator n=1 Tax=Streptomyces sp. NBC_00536 TaxID=2975769 RepID=UPI002E7FB54C|nr:helix-turn-helix domain-containing protein [Streptomyces sp. NBC_00536]WUC84354.1 helix-turn-helix domain-containing protein [Streptomyces sp. NBC_00536]
MNAPVLLWGSFNVFAYLPNVPGPALRLLVHLMGTQEAGGRIVQTQQVIADYLGVDRALVSRGLKHLELARLVVKEGQGIYRLNPMVAAFHTPAEAQTAFNAMKPEDYLDVPDFEERYQAAVADDELARKRKAAERKKTAPVGDLTAHRRRRNQAAS